MSRQQTKNSFSGAVAPGAARATEVPVLGGKRKKRKTRRRRGGGKDYITGYIYQLSSFPEASSEDDAKEANEIIHGYFASKDEAEEIGWTKVEEDLNEGVPELVRWSRVEDPDRPTVCILEIPLGIDITGSEHDLTAWTFRVKKK